MAKKTKKLSPSKYGLGWLPDLPDARDYMYAAPLRVAMKLATKIDLRPGCTAIYDQGRLGSCVSNALGAAFEFGKKKQRKATFMPSRLFMYYNQRIVINTVNSDSGAFIRDGIKSLNRQGVCKETLWTYDDNNAPGAKFTQKPPAICYTQALANQIISYQRLTHNLNTLKGCLAEGLPFVFGFTVYDSFMTSTVARTGIMPMPNLSKEHVRGGHAVMAVGYDDAKKAFIVRNSWGTGWGIKGYFWMPYAFITGLNFTSDFWTIRLVE
ncbi:MAG: C1 family peptidase [Saprospiraceae bacterium]|nr:C1 family peptidase [Saprospiraceae bacterium]